MSQSRHEEGILVRFWRTDHAAGDEILWPPSPWPTLVYAESGTLRVVVEDRWYLLPPRRALWVTPGMVFSKRATGSCRVRSLYFSPSLGGVREAGPFDVRPLLHELILKACQEGPLLKENQRHEAMVNLLLSEVVLASPEAAYLPLPADSELRAAMLGFIEFPVGLDELAEQVSMSRRTLERRVRDQLGMSLGEWAVRVRAMGGMRSLAEGKSLTEASAEAGYASVSAFCQVFRRVFGETPRRWQARVVTRRTSPSPLPRRPSGAR